MINPSEIPLNGVAWSRFMRVVRAFAASEVGWKAKALAGLLILFLFAINGFNVVSSFVGRDFMTAVADRNMGEFVWQAVLYVGVFGVSTVVAVFYRFSEERLGLLMREWLTRKVVTLYLEHPVYYRLDETGSIANPDQRIADDVKAFAVTTLSFVLMILNGSFTIVAFSGVMWSISPMLFAVAVLYAGFGSYLTIFLGRPLVWLNYNQLDKEANFRSDLIHVRENAESIALLRREGRLRARILRHFDELVRNFRQIIGINRNLGFFTTGYNYLIQIIPALLVAPMFIRGEVEFGVITQSAIAFAQLLGAFSLIVTQFQSISSFAAVIARLGSLWEAIEQARSPSASAIKVQEDNEGSLIYQDLSLRSPRDGQMLLRELALTLPVGKRLFISGPNERAKLALFRATSGIWDAGEGTIVRPGLDRILLLPERPYLPPGTLRDCLVRTGQEAQVPDAAIISVLHALDLKRVVEQAGGLDTERNWDDLLSLGEQQMLAFARVLIAAPRFAFFDRPSTALSASQLQTILRLLTERGIAYLTIGDGDDRENRGMYDGVLELAEDASWKFRATHGGWARPAT
jgi:vitamin B12/bleomycin/antimicrobial peptide transport system ATP-binding/permease protein